MTIVNTNRTFGVEIEFNRSQDSCTLNELQRRLHVALTSEGFTGCWTEIRYTHQVMNQWKVVTDSTVSGGEVVSPPLSIQDQGFDQIKIVCKVIHQAGFNVRGTKTGLHIHHDVNDLTVRQVGHIYGLYASFQTLISSSLAPSRRNSRRDTYNYLTNYNDLISENRASAKAWAKETKTVKSYTEIQDEHTRHYTVKNEIRDKATQYNRNTAVNLASIGKYGTIEFRQHQGTLNAKKIINWVLVTQAIVERFVQHKITWTEPKTEGVNSTKSDWIRSQRALRVNLMSTKGQDNAEVFTSAFNFMKKNIKKFAKQQR